MGLHLFSSKTVVFVSGVLAAQLYKSGFINSVANKALDGVEGLLGSKSAEKIRTAKTTEKKAVKKSPAKA